MKSGRHLKSNSNMNMNNILQSLEEPQMRCKTQIEDNFDYDCRQEHSNKEKSYEFPKTAKNSLNYSKKSDPNIYSKRPPQHCPSKSVDFNNIKKLQGLQKSDDILNNDLSQNSFFINNGNQFKNQLNSRELSSAFGQDSICNISVVKESNDVKDCSINYSDVKEISIVLEKTLEKNQILEEKLQNKEKILNQMKTFQNDLHRTYEHAQEELINIKKDKNNKQEELNYLIKSLQETCKTLENENTQLQCANKQLEQRLNNKKQILQQLQIKYEEMEKEQQIVAMKYDKKIDNLIIELNKQKKYYEEKVLQYQKDSQESLLGMEKLIKERDQLIERLQQQQFNMSTQHSSSICEPQQQIQQIQQKRSVFSSISSKDPSNTPIEPQSSPNNNLQSFHQASLGNINIKGEVNQLQQQPSKQQQSILLEIMQELEVENREDSIQKIHQLKSFNKEAGKLIDCLTDMIINCAPEGYFESKPTLKQIWKWLKSILKEYMILKKQQMECDQDRNLLKLVGSYLVIENQSQIIPKLAQLLVDNEIMCRIIDIMKSKLKVAENLTLYDIEKMLENVSDEAQPLNKYILQQQQQQQILTKSSSSELSSGVNPLNQ